MIKRKWLNSLDSYPYKDNNVVYVWIGRVKYRFVVDWHKKTILEEEVIEVRR